MKVSFFPKIYSAVSETKSMRQVVDIIRSNVYRNIVEQVRAADNIETIRDLKTHLPIFSPTFISSHRKLDPSLLATGIVQFDFDEKLLAAQRDTLVQKICAFPATAYSFISPSGGLKFGINTDFTFDPRKTPDINNKRFGLAYDVVEVLMHDLLHVQFDRQCRSIAQTCYLSHDPDAYFNPDCEQIAVNHFCVVEDAAPLGLDIDTDQDFIMELLEFIPKDLGYRDRIPINFAVLGECRGRGLAPLMAHWSTADRTKLERDLKYQMFRAQPGWTGYLVKKAGENGWSHLLTTKRRNQKALPSEHKFEPLLNVEDAFTRMEGEITDFFASGTSRIIRTSCGAGKTRAVVKQLAKLPLGKRVLFLAKSHSLIEEIDRNLSREISENLLRQGVGPFRKIIRGKLREIGAGNHMCENRDVVARYKKSIPKSECFGCVFGMQCRYTEQFNEPASIRFVTFDEYYNEQSMFWHGTDLIGGKVVARKSGWTPDYIIIDEDCLRVEFANVGSDCPLQSVTKIVALCQAGNMLEDSVLQAEELIEQDVKSRRASMQQGDHLPLQGEEILFMCNDFLRGDIDKDSFSKTVKFSEAAITLSRIKPVATRHVGIPTLILDATADGKTSKLAFPRFQFVSLPVASSPDVKIHQAQNANISKSFLSRDANRTRAIEEVRRIATKYKTVGVITYKRIDGFERFDKWVAEQIDAQCHGYFGDLRGTNAFADVDCLIILGRHAIGYNDLVRYGQAIYGAQISTERVYAMVPVRMKNGKSMSLSNFIFSDERTQNLYNQFCRSETVQAVGRSRPIHGKAKDVYLFSNESLGEDVEITDFFDYDHGEFSDIEIPDDVACVEEKRSELIGLGFSEHRIKNNKEGIYKHMAKKGFMRFSVDFKDKHYKRKRKTFFSRKQEALSEFVEGTILNVSLLD